MIPGVTGFRAVVQDSNGNIVAQQTVHSIDSGVDWAQGTIEGLGSSVQQKAKALIVNDADGALFTGLAMKVEGSVEDALDRLEQAITQSVPLPRISDTGKGDSASGIWQGKAATLAPSSFRSVGGTPQEGETAVSNYYSQDLAGAKQIFGLMGKMENEGEPLGEVLYAPIVEPDNADTFGFIMG